MRRATTLAAMALVCGAAVAATPSLAPGACTGEGGRAGQPMPVPELLAQPLTRSQADLTAAAERGDAAAQFLLADGHLNGRYGEVDDDTALRWYRRSAEQGHPQAQFVYGWLTARGRGVPFNPPEAVRWYRRAADQGLRDAQYVLGEAHATGFGLPAAAPDEAVRWYRLAAAQRHPRGLYKMGLAYRDLGGPAARGDAVACLSQAAALGIVDAARELADMPGAPGAASAPSAPGPR